MAIVLERSTFALFRSRDESGLDPLLYLINPDLTPVTVNGVLAPSKYWLLAGDILSLKTRAQMDAADAAELAAAQAAAKAQIDAATQWYLDLRTLLLLTPAQIQAGGDAEKAAIDALTDPGDVEAYADTRPLPPSGVR